MPKIRWRHSTDRILGHVSECMTSLDGIIFRIEKEEKKMDIKIGDKVVSLFDGLTIKKGNEYTVAEMNIESHYYGDDIRLTLIDTRTGKKVYGVSVDGFKKVEPPKHQGKILIMVDEKDNNKIIARDLLINKTSEAKCNQKDKWDFNKGAKLALERLTESEKPKGWTGKVVCVCNNVDSKYHAFHNLDFVAGKVYAVKDGYIISEQHRVYNGITLIKSPEQLSWTDKSSPVNKCPYRCKFIEYKGGAEE